MILLNLHHITHCVSDRYQTRLSTEGLLVAYQERWTPSATQSWSTMLIPANGCSQTTTGCHRCFHPWCSAGAYMRKFGYSSHKTEQRIVIKTDVGNPVGDGASRAFSRLVEPSSQWSTTGLIRPGCGVFLDEHLQP
jgi:hypothetical protein